MVQFKTVGNLEGKRDYETICGSGKELRTIGERGKEVVIVVKEGCMGEEAERTFLGI